MKNNAYVEKFGDHFSLAINNHLNEQFPPQALRIDFEVTWCNGKTTKQKPIEVGPVSSHSIFRAVKDSKEIIFGKAQETISVNSVKILRGRIF